jgi:Mce-associated membrane protein
VKSSVGNSQRHHRWSVDLVKVDGRWLIDGFDPVN